MRVVRHADMLRIRTGMAYLVCHIISASMQRLLIPQCSLYFPGRKECPLVARQVMVLYDTAFNTVQQ